ncbi:MAG: putative heme-binding domain-containing protein, partial [Limisphaerales bacterium]
FAKQYGRPFLPGPSAPKQKSNEELFDFLMSDKSKGGDAKRGREVYLKAQCAECHGRGEKPGLLFGPDLAGAAQRLNRKELAEAIVYPSRVVVERFKAMEVELKDGESLTGFITEQTDQFVTLATKEKIHRIPRSKVEGIRPQSLSLMPEGALAALTEKEIRDLIGCLKSF